MTKIGQGTFGEVFKARLRSEKTKIVALKKVLMENEKEGFPITALREIRILQVLNHENIVNLIEICRQYSRHNKTTFYLVFDFCEHDLAGLLSNVNVQFSKGEIKKVMQQMFEGLFYIHTNKIIHRDMKAANILITRQGILKLADFGLARAISINKNGQPNRYTNRVVTLWYRPPELLLGERNYGPPVDMWGAGCIMAEMWTRSPIMQGNTEQHQLTLIAQLCGAITTEVWPTVESLELYSRMDLPKGSKRRVKERLRPYVRDPYACDLIDKLLSLDPAKRINSDDALMHDFFWTDPLPYAIIELLLTRANDVESNPGPRFQERLFGLEKIVMDMQKEHRGLYKAIEHQGLQIVNVLRSQGNKAKTEETLTKLAHDMFLTKETLESQGNLIKRQMAQMAAMNFEMSTLRKLNTSQKNELKFLSSLSNGTQDNLQGPTHHTKSDKSEVEDIKQRVDEQSESIRDLNERLTKMDSFVGDVNEKVEDCEKNAKASVAHLGRSIKNNSSILKALNCNLNKVAEDSMGHRTGIAKVQTEQESLSCQLVETKTTLDGDLLRIDSDLDEVKRESHELLEMAKNKLANLEMNLYNNIENVTDLSDRIDVATTTIDAALEEAKEQIKGHSKYFEDVIDEAEKDRAAFREDMDADFKAMKEQQHVLHNQVVQYVKVNAQEYNSGTRKTLEELEERMDELDGMYDDIQDRVFEIDKNRKNNLVFYGVKGDELDPDDCELRIKDLLNTYLLVTREIPLTKVQRVWNGPSFRGFKPVLVSFQLFKDKEEILRKAHLLKGTNVYLTEDFSRKVRHAREELIKFARDIRAHCPTAKCSLQYDRLIVDNDAFLFNSTEGKVEKVLMRPSIHDGHQADKHRTTKSSKATSGKSQGCQTPVSPNLLEYKFTGSKDSPVPNSKSPTNRGFGDGVSSSDEELDLVNVEMRTRSFGRLRPRSRLPKRSLALAPLCLVHDGGSSDGAEFVDAIFGHFGPLIGFLELLLGLSELGEVDGRNLLGIFDLLLDLIFCWSLSTKSVILSWFLAFSSDWNWSSFTFLSPLVTCLWVSEES
eukprot:snap_masked-scaffold198_size266703-processed-gene-1.7 protein:Tk12352 transcript:snap_masked-scaffold198_size266703-processed-gene-1.7-mRNA-1 annotation:"hypothetical protein DAPPUDRAFT_215456"